MGLQAARRGIGSALAGLAGLKARERDALAAEAGVRAEAVAGLEGLARKRAGILQAVRGLEEEFAVRGPGGGEADGWRGEEGRLAGEVQEAEEEMRRLEARVRGLRRRLALVRKERAERESVYEARASSWQAALKEVDRAEAMMLDRFRPAAGRAASGSRSRDGGSRQGRSADRVRDRVGAELVRLRERQAAAGRDADACGAGAAAWGEVVGLVGGVERRLKAEMGRLAAGADGGAGGAGPGPEKGMQAMVELMGRVVATLEGALARARGKGWNFLVCAIEAEVEALREGREMLADVLGAGSGRSSMWKTAEEGLGVSAVLDGKGAVAVRSGSVGGGKRSAVEDMVELVDVGAEADGDEDEDDEPSPELLISRQEED
jgi:hypothetical protein